MRKEIYPLLSLLAFTVILSSATAQSICDSVFIEPDLETIEVCPEGSVVLTVNGGSDFNWSPEEDFDDPSAQTVTLTPSGSQWYSVTFAVGDTTCTDSVFVSIPTVMPTFSLSVSTTETICPLDLVTVTFQSNLPISAVSWNTTDGVLDSSSVTGSDITPLETTEYIVTAIVGGCTLMDTFTIDVINFRFRLTHPDTIYLCLGDSITINHNLFPNFAMVVWSPLDSTINLLTNSTAIVSPTISTSYSATATLGECILSTTTFVRVDSLPDTSLVVIPVKDPYCAGEMITIFAQRADTMKYPDIEFQWFPMDGIQDSSNTGNVFITLNDTTEFFRVMTNNACLDTSSVIVNVIPPTFPLSVMDTMLCPGDMFLVEILDLDVMEIEWTPKQGLSCNDCFNPTVTVQDFPIPYMVQGEKENCTVTGMLNVSLLPDLLIDITPDTAIACPGDQIMFSFSDSLLSNIEVNVTGDATVSCTNCTNPVVTFGNDSPVQLIVNADETSDMHCSASGSATITKKENETEQLFPIELCENEPTQIQLPANLVNPMLVVNNPNNATLSCTDCLDPIVTLTNNGTTLFISSESQTGLSCTLETSVFLAISADDLVTLNFDSVIGQGEIVSISLVSDPMPPPNTIYNWTVNGNPVAGTSSTNSVQLNEASNVVHVEWINSKGCLQSTESTITTRPAMIRIPNAFTPGRTDSDNTHFKVEITGNYQILEMLVFNRWGQVVYEGTSDEGWDGRRDGEVAPPEVYVYMIRLRDPAGREIIEKGDVTLIR